MTDLNVTAQLEVDDGTGSSRQFSVADLQVAQTGAAKESTLTAGLGTDGASPPTITGTGARGWLHAIYEKLSSGLTVTVTNPGGGSSVDVSTLAKDATLTGGTARTQVTNFPATQPVSGTVAVSNPTTNPETGLAKDATLTTLVGGPGSGVATITGSGSGIQGLLRMIWDTLRGGIGVTGTFWQATQPVSIASTVAVDTAAAAALAISNGGSHAATKYRGISVTDSSGSTSTTRVALVRVRDGNGGTILDTVPLVGGEGVSYTYPSGRAVAGGSVYIEVVSGTVEGSVFYS